MIPKVAFHLYRTHLRAPLARAPRGAGGVREKERALGDAHRAFESVIEVPDNVLAIAQDREIMTRLDAAFFRVGTARGGTLVKYQL